MARPSSPACAALNSMLTGVNWDAMLLRMKRFLPEEDFSFDIWERDNWHRLISSKRWRRPNPESLTDKEEVEHKVACSSA